jgi:hypothetical protein
MIFSPGKVERLVVVQARLGSGVTGGEFNQRIAMIVRDAIEPGFSRFGEAHSSFASQLASTTLAEAVCAQVFQGFVFCSTDTAETVAEG